ncbi:MAG: hypothetical protein KA258_05130 [Deltaproteobacteria bacterium]|jgi:hypothetical protein|nr:hypothetical protein [Deltaproteobacteria bacterium]
MPSDFGKDRSSSEESSEDRGFRERLEQFLPDVVRRAISAGSTAILSPEETIRRLVSDFNLPREVATYLLVQASSSKDEVLRVVGQEVRHFLESVNLSGELQKLLTSLSFEIKTEIRFIPNDAAVKPDIKNKVTVKRGKDDAGEP